MSRISPVVIALYSIKGGVGKTAAAVNLSSVAAAHGARTLVWDLDPQAAASFYFRIRPKVKGGAKRLVAKSTGLADAIRGTDYDNLDLLPGDFSFRYLDLELDGFTKRDSRLGRVVGPILAEYDYVFVDCPPSISLLSENVFNTADAVLAPLIPTTLSVRTLEQLEPFLAEGFPELALRSFFSIADARKRLHRDVMEAVASTHAGVLKTSIPTSADIERMGTRRAPVGRFAPSTRAADAYEDLFREVAAEFPGW